MNSRERLFFKNVELHKSMSYRKKEDKENVDKMRNKYRKELMEKQEIKAKQIKKYNSIFYRCIMYIFK
jgi:hypothetical protein